MFGWLKRIVDESRGNAVWDFVKWGSLIVIAALVVLIARLVQHYRSVPSDLVVDAVLLVTVLILGAFLIGIAAVSRVNTGLTRLHGEQASEPFGPPILALEGQVSSGDKKTPLPHAIVIARNDETGREYLSASNIDGGFEIWVPEGLYTVTARCQGYYEHAEAFRPRTGWGVDPVLQKMPHPQRGATSFTDGPN